MALDSNRDISIFKLLYITLLFLRQADEFKKLIKEFWKSGRNTLPVAKMVPFSLPQKKKMNHHQIGGITGRRKHKNLKVKCQCITFISRIVRSERRRTQSNIRQRSLLTSGRIVRYRRNKSECAEVFGAFIVRFCLNDGLHGNLFQRDYINVCITDLTFIRYLRARYGWNCVINIICRHAGFGW